jgi:hypothetical protein
MVVALQHEHSHYSANPPFPLRKCQQVELTASPSCRFRSSKDCLLTCFGLKITLFLPINDSLCCTFFCSQQKVFRNYDPALRSQEKAVEYTRALNAAKLEKVCLVFLLCICCLFLTVYSHLIFAAPHFRYLQSPLWELWMVTLMLFRAWRRTPIIWKLCFLAQWMGVIVINLHQLCCFCLLDCV